MLYSHPKPSFLLSFLTLSRRDNYSISQFQKEPALTDYPFSQADLQQIERHGLTPEQIKNQMETIIRGLSPLKLIKPCTLNKGILGLDPGELEKAEYCFKKEIQSKRWIHFIPASGAASRMFKPLLSLLNNYPSISRSIFYHGVINKDPDFLCLEQFLDHIHKFAFFEELQTALKKKTGMTVKECINHEHYREILEALLTPEGLNYGRIPKALIKFHKKDRHALSPVEEHIFEAAFTCSPFHKNAQIHFTISEDFLNSLKDYVENRKNTSHDSLWPGSVTFSVQSKASDTIALNLENNPFRDSKGRLVLRPAGHGALLQNLSQYCTGFDIAFIKNIDNVQTLSAKKNSLQCMGALAGILFSLQEKIFLFQKELDSGNPGKTRLQQILEFIKETLSITPAPALHSESLENQKVWMQKILNRPLRVCGLVRNKGEIGGLPFWVENQDKSHSLQIVETSQIDLNSNEVMSMVRSSTHFNPVFMVLGLKNHKEEPFDLNRYSEPEGGIISIKSFEGKNLKALELPGLWNGGMYYWNTVFAEIPESTFVPVKIFTDLLAPEHQGQ